MVDYVYKSIGINPVIVDNYIVTKEPGLQSKYQIEVLDALMGTSLNRYDDGVLKSKDNIVPANFATDPTTGQAVGLVDPVGGGVIYLPSKTYTWASRPLVGVSNGELAYFSDIGNGSSPWVFNGSDWALQSAIPAYTFVTLPLPTAYTGTAFVIDIGEHGSLWYSNGITWGVVGGSVDLYSSAVAQPAHTGVLATTVQKSFTLPGGLLGLNGAYRLFARWSCTNNANLKIAYSRMGATPFTGVGFTTVASIGTMAEVQNRNSLTSQIGSNGSPSMSSNGANAFSTHAINTAADHTLDFAAQLANVGDSMTLESYRVTLIRP